MNRVAAHYGTPGMLEKLLAGFQSQGKEAGQLTLADLGAVDEFHIRGRLATVELGELAAPAHGSHVLDAGSGLGGSTRFLSATYGCRVTGVDLTAEYCRTAAGLSRLVGLDSLNRYVCADTVQMPFADATFDLAWTQHVQMNIENKAGFYGDIARVLRPGGRFAFHDLLAGPGGAAYYPAHWADEASMSFLIAPEDLQALLERSGFRIVVWRDMTEISRTWFMVAMEERKKAGPPPLGLHLLLREHAQEKFINVGRNLQEERLTVVQALVEKV